MKRASGIGHLKPFLPGLETLLEDPEVSEIRINGPGNVWIERGGRLEPHEAPGLTAAWLHRAAIHNRPAAQASIPPPDPSSLPVSRTARGSPSARRPRVPRSPSPSAGSGAARSRPTTWCAWARCRRRSSEAARSALLARRNILVSGRHGLGQDDAPQRADPSCCPKTSGSSPSRTRSNSGSTAPTALRFEAGAVGTETPVSIRDLVRHALRHRPDHIVVGEVRGGEAADLLQALNTGHGGSLTTIHANNARSALSRLASCAMQAEGALPWEVTCRGVVDGIALVLHTARQRGRRFVEEGARSARLRRGQGPLDRRTDLGRGPTKPRKNSTHTPRR